MCSAIVGVSAQKVKNELDIVGDVSQKLLALQIPFMLTGSMALNFYAQPRMTRDIDLVLDLKSEDVPLLAKMFETDYYVSSDSAMDAVREESQFNLIHFDSVIKVDCIVRKSSDHAKVEFERRQPITIQSIQTFVVSKEDLILAKLAWARKSRSEVQLRDVRDLLLTGCDRQYLDFWAGRLALTEVLEECTRG